MTDLHADHLSDPGPLIPGGRHHAFLAEARELLRLAVPLAATQLAQMVILATDTVMLGHFSKEALAAAALGNTVYFLVWLLGNGLPMAVSPVIAHVQGRHGATVKPRDQREVRIAVRMGLWSVAMSSLPLLCVLIFTRPILLFLDQEPKLASDAAVFMSGLAWGLPFAQLFHRLVARGAADGGDGAGDPVERLRRLCPDLRAFRRRPHGPVRGGTGQRQLQHLQLHRHAGGMFRCAGASPLPHPAPAVACGPALLRRTLSSGAADRRHHGV
jgi:hypothetical protein